MRIRLGYVSISNVLNVTLSSIYTYSEYLNKHNLDKLDKVIISDFNVIVNSIGNDVVNSSVEILKYHYNILNKLI